MTCILTLRSFLKVEDRLNLLQESEFLTRLISPSPSTPDFFPVSPCALSPSLPFHHHQPWQMKASPPKVARSSPFQVSFSSSLLFHTNATSRSTLPSVHSPFPSFSDPPFSSSFFSFPESQKTYVSSTRSHHSSSQSLPLPSSQTALDPSSSVSFPPPPPPVPSLSRQLRAIPSGFHRLPVELHRRILKLALSPPSLEMDAHEVAQFSGGEGEFDQRSFLPSSSSTLSDSLIVRFRSPADPPRDLQTLQLPRDSPRPLSDPPPFLSSSDPVPLHPPNQTKPGYLYSKTRASGRPVGCRYGPRRAESGERAGEVERRVVGVEVVDVELDWAGDR